MNKIGIVGATGAVGQELIKLIGKKDYDLDVKNGKLPDGREILKSDWLDNSTNPDRINEVANELFQELFKK